jgi:hypothetical protein
MGGISDRRISMRLPLPAAPFWLCLLALATPARANDGWGGLSATGLTFGQTEAIAMEEEDLFISPDRVNVDYVFHNLTLNDVTGEVIFPLPPIGVWSMLESMWNLPEDPTRENLVNFSATVDGQPVDVKIDRIAVIEPPWEEGRPLNEQYDTPGRDVTAELARFNLPMTLDYQAVSAALLALSPEDQAAAKAAGIADYYEGDPAQGIPAEGYPLWSIVYRYHWTQTFPAGARLRVHHEYENRPAGGLFYFSSPPEDYHQYLVDQYCIDQGTAKAIVKTLERPEGAEYGNYGTALNIAYVLRTANSWAGPIGKFRLTLDKGSTGNVISLCAEGVTKAGPTTFVIEKTDFTPDRDLEILVVQPLEEN